MSHVGVGMEAVSPLSTYNSLTDGHLTGYFSSPRKRKHLRKAGLISRSGHLISDNTFRLNMMKRDRKRHIKSTLAQAIVEKTLELERHRQNVIKQKLEEIAKLELVQRVRDEENEQPITKWSSRPNSSRSDFSSRPSSSASQKSKESSRPTSGASVKPEKKSRKLAILTTETEQRKRNEEMLPYLSPRSPRRPVSGPANNKTSYSFHGKYRPISAPVNNRPISGSTKASTNYDDEDDEDVEYIDVNGRPASPGRNGDSSYRDNSTLDLNQLYTLNTAALRKYAMTLAKMEQGRGANSPYVTASTVPMPPRSPRIVSSPRSRRYNGSVGNLDRSPRRTVSGQNYLHHTESVTVHPGQLQSMVEIRMKYHGWNLTLARDEIDPRNLVVIEQQHCGGNTLTVFKQKLLPKSEFSFVSHRHRGYPFSLTIYVDGSLDSRVSTCCEYRHAKNVRLGGANGHFSILDVKGNIPCYKCQVERAGKNKKKKKQRPKPEPMVEEVTVLDSFQKTQVEATADSESEDTGNYDDDFEESDAEQDDNKKNESANETESSVANETQNSDANETQNRDANETEYTKANKTAYEDVQQNEVTPLDFDAAKAPLDFDEAKIRGMSLDSPRDSGNRSPTEQDYDVQVQGRKIDGYSSEEEDLEGPKGTIVVVENDDNVPRKGKSQPTAGQDDVTNDNKKIRTSKSVPTKPQKSGTSTTGHKNKQSKKGEEKDKNTDTKEKPQKLVSRKMGRQETLSSHSESEDSTPRSQKQSSPEIEPNLIKTPTFSLKDHNEKKARAKSKEQSEDVQVKNNQKNEPESPENNRNKDKEEKHKTSKDKSRASSRMSLDSPIKSPDSPVRTPDVAQAVVWSEDESELSQSKNSKQSSSPDNEDAWKKKRVRIAENTIDEFRNMEDENEGRYEADDEDTERNYNAVRVGEEILKQFGQDPEEKTRVHNRNGRVAEEVLKQFGKEDNAFSDPSEKNRRVAEEITKQFGKENDAVGGPSEKNRRVAEEITKQFGKENDAVGGPSEKNRRVAEEITKQFGKEDDAAVGTSEKNRRVAEEITKQFGKESSDEREQEVTEQILKQFGVSVDEEHKEKNQRVAEEIVKEFGQPDSQKSSLEKKQQIAEAVQNYFGNNPDEQQSEAIESKKKRITEEIIRQFGDDSTESRQRVAEEIIKLYGKDPDQISQKVSTGSRQWRTDEEIKPSQISFKSEVPKRDDDQKPIEKEGAVLVSKSLPEDNFHLQAPSNRIRTNSDISNSESLNSTEREIRTKKKDSEEFFRPAIEKKQRSVSVSSSDSSSGSETDSDSSYDSDASHSEADISSKPAQVPGKDISLKPVKTPAPVQTNKLATESSSVSTSTLSSSVTPLTSSAAATISATSQKSAADGENSSPETQNKNSHNANDSGSDDSSSDSDSDSETESSSSGSSGSSSDDESEKESKTKQTQQPIQQTELKDAGKSDNSEQKDDDTYADEENTNQNGSSENDDSWTDPTKSDNHEVIPSKSKSVTFRNTPEQLEYQPVTSESDGENMHGGNDPDNVAGESPTPTVRTFPSKSGVESGKIHGGSILHLLEAENDIQLDGISLDKHQIQEICEQLESKDQVKTLSLRNCGLKDEDVIKITDAIILSPSEPVMINLNLNNLTHKSMESMVEIMQAEPTLDILLLQGNDIGDEGARILADGIMKIHHEARKRRKASLLRQNSELQIVQVHAHEDGTVVPKPSQLQKRRSSLFDPAREARFCRVGELDLGDVELTDAGMEHIARLLELNVYIETLSLSSNPAITRAGWLRLSQALEKNRRLQNLTLDFNNLGDDGTTLLCRGLKDNRSLVALDLEETGIGERGGRMLVELLKRNTTLLDMTLTPGNNISEPILLEIKRFLALNKATDNSY